ncbi:EamA family transporter [Spirulina subsalsa FACHB-351]|uniref:EamA family transporter n=1 Tax=Spirulina subsalsa FACHB-351 TaxID=234711 RepID=A0ABT3L9Y8_9CYAN|nr:DMT family transporter [Spirulina subsalsa]MCW6038323.1 EamA family transporter [Spirulina subsalsa FACHB-351]
MGPLDKQPDFNHGDPNIAEDHLRQLTAELEHLKQNILLQLSQEIDQLQNRKTRLLAETEQLELQRQEQLSQQQDLAKQLAPALAEQILQNLQSRLDYNPLDSEVQWSNGNLGQYNQQSYRLIASLDETLRATFRTLQQDLSSYQSSLSQQLGQMYSLEQQGEIILDALVNRLREQLQTQDPVIPPSAPIPPRFETAWGQERVQDRAVAVELPTLPPEPTSPAAETPPVLPRTPVAPPPAKKKVSVSQLQLGFILVLLSSLALSLQNVVIRIILSPSTIFGWREIGGFITPGFGNSLLILFLRMVVVVPCMAILAQVLYPSSWSDIRRYLQSKDWAGFSQMIACGFFLFASSAFIYMALGDLSPGVALTLFFIFPVVTVILSWLFFGEKPSLVRSAASLTVFAGVVILQLPSGGGAVRLSTFGIVMAILSGVTFALHVLLIQACMKKIHPIPFSVVNFFVIFVFTLVSLPLLLYLPLPDVVKIDIDPAMWVNLLISGLVLGGLTLLSYLANNIGISYIGAARASIFGATGPAFTSLMAAAIIGATLTFNQWIGMGVVTAGVLAQNLERFFKKPPAPKVEDKQGS